MVIYLVTKEPQNANRCGTYKDFYCYVMDFMTYYKQRMTGNIFSTAKQALNYMIRNAK